MSVIYWFGCMSFEFRPSLSEKKVGISGERFLFFEGLEFNRLKFKVNGFKSGR